MIPSATIYQSLLDSMHTAVLLWDDALQLQYMNAAAENLLKLSANRNDGIAVEHIFSENGRIPEGLIKAQKTQQRFTKRKTILRLPAPKDITVDYTVTPVSEDSDWLLMEIEPLDRAIKISEEEMLLSSQAVSQQLIRGLAHEIKNPLGGLRGAAQLLERELADPELTEYTDIIIAEADRLRNLVNQMLGSHKKLQLRPLNIHEVLEHVRKLLNAESQNQVKIVCDYDPSLPDINADKEQLIQAVLNVAGNALQVLDGVENPLLTLRTRIQRKFTISNTMHDLILRLDVIDNGPGIPDHLYENVFFPMVTGRAEGTGLGLSIAQSIVNHHKGLIKFESEPGNTVFSLYLPLELEHE